MHKQGLVCIIVMEEGIAHIFIVGRNTSKLKAKIEKRISKKKAFSSQHDKQKDKFFDQIIAAMNLHVAPNAGNLKSVVIGSPGFTKDAFYQYMLKDAEKKGNVFIKSIIDKTIVAHTSSGFKHSLTEIMQNKTV